MAQHRFERMILWGALLIAISAGGLHARQEVVKGSRPPGGTYGDPLLHFPLRHASSVAFFPDGNIVAAGGKGEAYLWDAATGAVVRRIALPDDEEIIAIAPAPDGKTLATAGPRSVRLWDTETGKERFALLKESGSLPRWAVFSPDGKTLATPGFAKNKAVVTLWDAVTGKERARIELPSLRPILPALLGKTVITCASVETGSVIQFWDAATGRETRKIESSVDVDCLVGSPDRTTIAFSGREASGPRKGNAAYHVREVETGKDVKERHWHTGSFRRLDWSPDGTRLMYSHLFPGGMEALVVMSVGTYEETHEFHNDVLRGITGTAFSPNGGQLAVSLGDKGMTLYPTPRRTDR